MRGLELLVNLIHYSLLINSVLNRYHSLFHPYIFRSEIVGAPTRSISCTIFSFHRWRSPRCAVIFIFVSSHIHQWDYSWFSLVSRLHCACHRGCVRATDRLDNKWRGTKSSRFRERPRICPLGWILASSSLTSSRLLHRLNLFKFFCI